MNFPWTGKVSVEGTALRSKPYRNSKRPHEDVVKDLPAGTHVEVVSQQGGWLSVRATLRGETFTGFISKELVTPIPTARSAKATPQKQASIPKKDFGPTHQITNSADNLKVAPIARAVQFAQMSMSSKSLGTHEYLAQKSDGNLYYIRASIHIDHALDDSNRIQAHARIEVLEEKLLDVYEQELEKQAGWEEWSKRASGRVEESNIIFEVMALGAAWRITSVAGRTLGIANIVKGLVPDMPSATGYVVTDAVAGEILNKFWERAVRRIGPLNNDWMVGIIAEGSAMLIGTFREKLTKPKPKFMTATQRLEKVRAFRFALSDKTWLRNLNTQSWMKDFNSKRPPGR